MYIVINELEKDVLREIISISLARAADSFSDFTKRTVLLDVPEVKIIEPKLLPDVVNEFKETYQVMRAGIKGELQGKTFLLFTTENIGEIADCCLAESAGNNYQELVEKMLLNISEIITTALAGQLSDMLQLHLSTEKALALFTDKAVSVRYILNDLPENQPFVIAIKTNFKQFVKTVELPMLIVFDAHSVSELLHVIRRSNIYDYKLLKSAV